MFHWTPQDDEWSRSGCYCSSNPGSDCSRPTGNGSRDGGDCHGLRNVTETGANLQKDTCIMILYIVCTICTSHKNTLWNICIYIHTVFLMMFVWYFHIYLLCTCWAQMQTAEAQANGNGNGSAVVSGLLLLQSPSSKQEELWCQLMRCYTRQTCVGMCRASNLLQVQSLFMLVALISCEHRQNLPRSARRRSFQRCLRSCLSFETWLI